MHANFTDSGSYRYTVMITDKVMNHQTVEYTENGTQKSSGTVSGTRVDLYKNTTLVYRAVLTGEDQVQVDT